MLIKNIELEDEIILKVNELQNIKTIDYLIIDIKGNTIIKDCTKLILNNQRYDYIDNKLIKVSKC